MFFAVLAVIIGAGLHSYYRLAGLYYETGIEKLVNTTSSSQLRASDWGDAMTTLQRIGVGSAFKIGAVVYGLMFLVFGLFGLLCNLALLAPLMSTAIMIDGDMVRTRDMLGGLGAASLAGLCFAYAVGVVASALGGGLSTALLALFYNWAVRWVGGLELDITGPGMQPGANVILGDMRSGMR